MGMFSISDFNNNKQTELIHEIWLAIMKMDNFALDLLLEDSIIYEDIGKQEFLEKLGNRFTHHKTLGDNELHLELVKCSGCKSTENVCKFTGNHSGESFALYFQFEEDEVIDIFHCKWYGNMDFLDSF